MVRQRLSAWAVGSRVAGQLGRRLPAKTSRLPFPQQGSPELCKMAELEVFAEDKTSERGSAGRFTGVQISLRC